MSAFFSQDRHLAINLLFMTNKPKIVPKFGIFHSIYNNKYQLQQMPINFTIKLVAFTWTTRWFLALLIKRLLIRIGNVFHSFIFYNKIVNNNSNVTSSYSNKVFFKTKWLLFRTKWLLFEIKWFPFCNKKQNGIFLKHNDFFLQQNRFLFVIKWLLLKQNDFLLKQNGFF